MQSTIPRRPANKGRRYPADPPRVEEIVAVMRQAGDDPHGLTVADTFNAANYVRSTSFKVRYAGAQVEPEL